MGTEHLLLGLLIEGEGIAAHVLEDLGANLEKVRSEIEKLLHESGLEEESKDAPKKASKTPLLDQFCRDLTELALKNQLDPVIGRAMEIERVARDRDGAAQGGGRAAAPEGLFGKRTARTLQGDRDFPPLSGSGWLARKAPVEF